MSGRRYARPKSSLAAAFVLHARLVFVPLPHLLVHEVFQAVLPVLLRFLSARSVTAWGHILTSAEEALQPHCKRDPIRPLSSHSASRRLFRHSRVASLWQSTHQELRPSRQRGLERNLGEGFSSPHLRHFFVTLPLFCRHARTANGLYRSFLGSPMHGCAWRSRGPVGAAVSHISRRTPSGAGAGRSTTSAPAHSPRWLSSCGDSKRVPLRTCPEWTPCACTVRARNSEQSAAQAPPRRRRSAAQAEALTAERR